jgi:hypothetical protein
MAKSGGVRRVAGYGVSSIAVALAAWALGGGQQAAAADDKQVGVNAAVNPAAQGTPPGLETRRLVLGQDIVSNERITTQTGGQTQILFVDESALTVGPNSDLTIDKFVYDPESGKGQLAMSAARGVARFVGGKISKLDNSVTLQTPAASIGIRGGVFLVYLGADGRLDIVFLYGKS